MNAKLTLPASCAALTGDEMTYTAGGGLISSLFSLATGALYIYNYAWGLNETRNWLKKRSTGDPLETAGKAADSTLDYVSQSLFNTVRGVLTAVQLVTFWPVTAVAWLTAQRVTK